MAKILIIEDVPDSANLARKILTKFEHEVLVAENGEEALSLAGIGDLDLILLDLGLPDVDGQTLLGMLRRDYDMENTPIIVCTAWPEDTALRMAEAYGFDGYISKPYTVNKLMDVVNHYLP
jgi:CheY-like chemotaxis protein